MNLKNQIVYNSIDGHLTTGRLLKNENILRNKLSQ